MGNSKLLLAALLGSIGIGDKLLKHAFTAQRSFKDKNASRSKYKPHQGKKECARRVRQMAAGVI